MVHVSDNAHVPDVVLLVHQPPNLLDGKFHHGGDLCKEAGVGPCGVARLEGGEAKPRPAAITMQTGHGRHEGIHAVA